jgi:hypothetical protein
MYLLRMTIPTTLKMFTAMPIGTTSELILVTLLYLSSSILNKIGRVWPESQCTYNTPARGSFAFRFVFALDCSLLLLTLEQYGL